jgi:uracil-DNA glycosylase
MDNKTKIQKLIEAGYITQDWANKYPGLFENFWNKIMPKLIAEKRVAYPDAIDIFKAFRDCPVEKVLVVCIAQDPYHDGSAMGVAFDNRKSNKKVSPSLRNVLKEIQADIGTSKADTNKHSYLEHLPAQGVLLLNTALTVAKADPLSHSGIWKDWTAQLVSDLQKTDNIVWLLWGNHAKEYKSMIVNETHSIVEGFHPSPYSAHKFFGGKYFSKINEILKNKKLKEIEW